MPARLTLKEVLKRIDEAHPGQYEVLPETVYAGSKIPISLKCRFCNRVRTSNLYDFVKKGCQCERSNRLTLEKIFAELDIISPGQYSIVPQSFYLNSRTPFSLKCNFCGELRTTTIQGFREQRCNCQISTKLTLKEVFTRIEKAHPQQYAQVPQTEYISYKAPITLKCNLCGNLRTAGLHNFLNQGCKCQAKEKRKQTCFENWGVDNPAKSPIVQAKMKKTCLKNLGVEYSMQNPDVRKKVEQTCLKNHGVKYPMQNPDVRKKAEQTCLKNHGAKNYTQSEKYLKEVKAKYAERKRRRLRLVLEFLFRKGDFSEADEDLREDTFELFFEYLEPKSKKVWKNDREKGDLNCLQD